MVVKIAAGSTNLKSMKTEAKQTASWTDEQKSAGQLNKNCTVYYSWLNDKVTQLLSG